MFLTLWRFLRVCAQQDGKDERGGVPRACAAPGRRRTARAACLASALWAPAATAQDILRLCGPQDAQTLYFVATQADGTLAVQGSDDATATRSDVMVTVTYADRVVQLFRDQARVFDADGVVEQTCLTFDAYVPSLRAAVGGAAPAPETASGPDVAALEMKVENLEEVYQEVSRDYERAAARAQANWRLVFQLRRENRDLARTLAAERARNAGAQPGDTSADLRADLAAAKEDAAQCVAEIDSVEGRLNVMGESMGEAWGRISSSAMCQNLWLGNPVSAAQIARADGQQTPSRPGRAEAGKDWGDRFINNPIDRLGDCILGGNLFDNGGGC